jgi:class 3 adenylate cyclase
MSKEFHYRWTWKLKSTPEELWPLVADTNRFNYDAGLSVVRRDSENGELPNARRRLSFSSVGVGVAWEEEPFEWVEPRRFGVRRNYFKGPIAHMRVQVNLEPIATGTELTYQIWVRERNFLGRLAIPIQIGILTARSFASVFQQYDRQLRQSDYSARVYATGDVRFEPGGKERLARIHKALLGKGVSPDLLFPIVEFIATASDLQASQLRPYELADLWGQPRRDLLETCLSATREGLLEYEWHLLCPLCRGAKARSQSLGDVVSRVHCDTCNIDFEVNFHQSVELTFHPNPSIRSILIGEYCIAGPRVTPHVVSQQLLQSGEERSIQQSLESGRYRLRTLQVLGGQYLKADDLEPRHNVGIRLGHEGWATDELAVNSDASITMANDTSEEQLFVLERLALNDQAATGADVIRLQRFRDLFAEEALRPGERISVGSQAIVFTDLFGSTEFYNSVGDASAFGMVMSHFDVIRESIEAEGGTVVKTMGDAVMAVFKRPISALKALRHAQEQMARKDSLDGFRLKVGIHYGSSVNIASRLEGLSLGADVVVSENVYEDGEVSEYLLNEPGIEVEKIEESLKGFSGKRFRLKRVRSSHLNQAIGD